MAVIAVLSIVISLLYAYSNQGWKLFYQSYGRGLSQVKTKTALRLVQEELREANKKRIFINRGTYYGVPLPDDVKDSSPFIYFTKPRYFEQTGDVTAYDYILYYFAKPKLKNDFLNTSRRQNETNEYLTLKSIKFTNQSKFYTEDKDKTWPFLPPILELQKSTLEEDKAYLASLKEGQAELTEEGSDITESITPAQEEQFADFSSKLKKDRKNIPISSNFLTSSLTDPFTNQEVNIFFGQDYKVDKPVKIKVSLEEPPLLFGLMSTKSEFEITVTPRN